MANQIQLVKPGVFFTKARGSEMTLSKVKNNLGNWQMETKNASQRAHRGLGIKYFDSLEQIEKQYKCWRGIAQIATCSDANSINTPKRIMH